MRLSEDIGEFLLALSAAGRSPKTIRWYSDILNRFAARGGALERHAIVAYLAARRDELAPASLAGEDRALRRLCHWLTDKGLLAEDPMHQVDRPRVPETVPRIATAETAIRLVIAAEDSKWPQRDRALVLVLADTGARLSEFLSITLANLQVVHRNGDFIDYGEALVVGKGGHRRRLLIGATAMSELAAWIAERPPEAGDVIWWGERGPLSPWGVREILERLCKRAGIARVNPHAFRHGAAIDHLQAGADLRTLQLLLGHAALSTTAQYLKLADKLVASVHDQVSEGRFGHVPPRRRR